LVYLLIMRRIGIGLVGLCLWAIACSATPAQLGARFAEVYTAFSPMVQLYGSYRDHLFLGTPVVIPEDVGTACERFAYELAIFHVEYVNQTESSTAAGLALLTRLRVESAAFCDGYEEWLRILGELEAVDDDLVGTAGDEGLFSAIKRMNDLIAETLDEILAGLGDGFDRWTFAVTFSVRALLLQTEIEQLDENTREILYGNPEATAPPFDVPSEVSEAMARLVDLGGRELTPEEVEEAFRSAMVIFDHFVPEA
jgi:hypothetical protein